MFAPALKVERNSATFVLYLYPNKLRKQVCAFRKDVVRGESTIISASHVGALANSGPFFASHAASFREAHLSKEPL